MFMDVGESCFSEYGKGCDFGLQIRVHHVSVKMGSGVILKANTYRSISSTIDNGEREGGSRHMHTTHSWGA